MTVAEQGPAAEAPRKRRSRLSVGNDGQRTRPSAQRSGRVARLKLLLPLVAGVIIALVLAWPQIAPDKTRFRLGTTKITTQDAESLRMTNARFVGTDERNRPYVVTATSAIQENALAPEVNLTEPKADMTMTDGSWTQANAVSGLYRRDRKSLELNGDVTIFHDSGAELHTEQAHIDLATRDASGEVAVHAQSPSGTIEGQGFKILDHGARIVFTGKSKAVLRQRPNGTS